MELPGWEHPLRRSGQELGGEVTVLDVAHIDYDCDRPLQVDLSESRASTPHWPNSTAGSTSGYVFWDRRRTRGADGYQLH